MRKLALIALICLLSITGSVYALEPGTYDIIMQAGEDYLLQLQLKDSTGTALDLRGYSYRAQFRSAAAPSGSVYATYSAVFSNASAGRLNVKLSKAQTETNTGKTGVWDLQQTDSGGSVSYVIKGKAVVQPTVTR